MTARPAPARERELREMARHFYILKDIVRLRILLTLATRHEMTVTELARALRISQPLVSFHLRPLRATGLVQVRRVGREVYYSIDLATIQRRQAEFIELLTNAANEGQQT